LQRFIYFGLDDLVSLILKTPELTDDLANGACHLGQFVRTKDQKRKQNDDGKLKAADTKH
jgi:hypothetical protein